jgi:hypothetical protein
LPTNKGTIVLLKESLLYTPSNTSYIFFTLYLVLFVFFN